MNTRKNSVPAIPLLLQMFVSVFEDAQRFDVREPLSSKNRIQRMITERFANVPPDLVTDLKEFIAAHRDQISVAPDIYSEVARELKKAACSDKRYSLLLNFARAADDVAPYLANLVWYSCSSHDHLFDQCHPLPDLDAASKATGEHRLRATLSALLQVVEVVYQPYVRALVELDLIMKGDCGEPARDLGTLVDQAAHRLVGYPGLIDGDAAWLRNAAAHQHFDYDDGADTVTVWDRKRPRMTLPVSALLDRAVSMWRIAGPTFSNVQEFLGARLLSQLGYSRYSWELLLHVGGDANKTRELISSFEERTALHLDQANSHIRALEQRRASGSTR